MTASQPRTYININRYIYSYLYTNEKDWIKRGIDESNLRRIEVLAEARNDLETVKYGNYEGVFLEKFHNASIRYSKFLLKGWYSAYTPKFIIEGSVFCVAVLSLLYIYSNTVNIVTAIPGIALYVLGGYKLLPTIQHLFQRRAEIKINRPALERVYKILDPGLSRNGNAMEVNSRSLVAVEEDVAIELQSVDVIRDEKKILDDTSIKLSRGDNIAL